MNVTGRDLVNVFTKLSIWRLTQYDKAVFLSANLLVIQNVDELFEKPELSATPNPGEDRCIQTYFNIILKPGNMTLTPVSS